jgi:hypothetical protein
VPSHLQQVKRQHQSAECCCCTCRVRDSRVLGWIRVCFTFQTLRCNKTAQSPRRAVKPKQHKKHLRWLLTCSQTVELAQRHPALATAKAAPTLTLRLCIWCHHPTHGRELCTHQLHQLTQSPTSTQCKHEQQQIFKLKPAVLTVISSSPAPKPLSLHSSTSGASCIAAAEVATICTLRLCSWCHHPLNNVNFPLHTHQLNNQRSLWPAGQRHTMQAQPTAEVHTRLCSAGAQIFPHLLPGR